MKKGICFVLCIIMVFSLLSMSASAANVVLSPQNLTVDGKPIECEKYNIDGSNYFKLRDIAYLLSGTTSQFEVGYDTETRTVTITSGLPYTPNGEELVIGKDKSSSAKPSTQSIVINGVVNSSISAYNLDGNNFFKLRDLGDILGFAVDYDKTTNTAIILSDDSEILGRYSVDIPPLSSSSVIVEKYTIISERTGEEYSDASFVMKASKYTNLESTYTMDEFFFTEFPQQSESLIGEINKGLIKCVNYNGCIYINDVNAIQFFREYGIEYYHNNQLYRYISQDIETETQDIINEETAYTVQFPELPDTFVVFAVYDIYSKETSKTYYKAQYEIKNTPYTNRVSGYFSDDFFFEEFPDYEYTIISAVNNGDISGRLINGEVYLEAVNMIQFFRQYSIEFYHLSPGFIYTQVE